MMSKHQSSFRNRSCSWGLRDTMLFFWLKVCLYRTRPRLGGVLEGMVEIKQTKVVYTERESERGTQL